MQRIWRSERKPGPGASDLKRWALASRDYGGDRRPNKWGSTKGWGSVWRLLLLLLPEDKERGIWQGPRREFPLPAQQDQCFFSSRKSFHLSSHSSGPRYHAPLPLARPTDLSRWHSLRKGMDFTTHAPASGGSAFQSGDSHGGEGLHVCPAAGGPPTHALIFLHGLGDTAHGWVDFARFLRQRKGVFEHFKFILPTAPLRPVTLNGGFPMPCWADIYGLSIQDKEDREGYDASVNRIISIIDREIEQGIPSTNIYLGGFSQGAATSYLAALTQKERTLGGIIALSGWLPFVRHDPKRFALIPDKTLRTPVLHCHGTADLMVAPEWGKATVQELKSMGFVTKWIAYRDMGHSASPEVFRDAAEFIEARVK